MRKIRFVALLLALALLLCACGAAKTPLEQAAAYLKKAAPNPGYGSLNGDWTVFGLARSGVQVAGKYYETYYGNVEAAVAEAGGKLSETKYTEYSGGDAFVTCLDGVGRITIDGVNYELREGDSIVMPARHPHAVFGQEQFKMLLVVVF